MGSCELFVWAGLKLLPSSQVAIYIERGREIVEQGFWKEEDAVF
jgi:hypothetical protein